MDDDLIAVLLDIEIENFKAVNSAESSGACFGVFRVDLLSVILDRLGVPQDSEDFQRDWFRDEWLRHCQRNADTYDNTEHLILFIRWLRQETRDKD